MLQRSYDQRGRSMVHETMNLMTAHILLDGRKLDQEPQGFYLELQPDAFRNTKSLQQMHLDDLAQYSDMDEGLTYLVHDLAAVKSQFFVGLEKPLSDMERSLFQNEVLFVGVRCMGGFGKTTLTLALSIDVHIKGYFQNRFFITVSQSPDVKGHLETLWDNIIGRKKSELLRQSKSTLLIFDDVWYRKNLLKLLFQVAGSKTLFTTRESSIIPRNHSIQFYQLPLLGQEDVPSLFCLHGESCEAWGSAKIKLFTTRESSIIPRNHSIQFYQLPLLGQEDVPSLFCLHGESCEAWGSAKIKLSKGKLVSDYHIDELIRFLETSIRFLDDVARECLGAFPDDKKICSDALFHIWVYARKLEWLESFAILLKLASRNLLNLISNPRSTAAMCYGNASELYFSQQDIIRDLALHLGGQGIAFQRNGLLVLSKENILLWKWELLKNRPFDAQIVSIHTGPMDKS